MRATEYFDFITRKDLALGHNPKPEDYTHLTITMLLKRERYNYQKELRRSNVLKNK